AGKLVDAVASGAGHSPEAWSAWTLLAVVYGAGLVIKNVAMRPWIYFASANMKELIDEAFRKVQAFSADWHADNFAGASVRRMALRAGKTGLLVWLWAKGEAEAGGVAFVITAVMLMTGYLRNIGENIRMTRRGLDDIEGVARYATTAPQVIDAVDAGAFRADL